MPDGTAPHVARCEKQLLRRHFDDDRNISRKFPTVWPPRSLNLNSRNFLLWGYFNAMIYCDLITCLFELKESIERHARYISQFMLHLTVDLAILRFQRLADNDGLGWVDLT